MYKKNFRESIIFPLMKVVCKILVTGCTEILMYTPDTLFKNLKKEIIYTTNLIFCQNFYNVFKIRCHKAVLEPLQY